MRRGPALLLLLAMLATLPVFAAANASGAFDFNDPAFESIGDATSIPDGVVSALAEDSAGFIWIGTPSGLVRYDGYRFRLHSNQPGNRDALGGSFIRALLVARDGRLWIGTESDGLSVYDPLGERFRSYRHDPADEASLPAGSVRAIAEAADGCLWVGTIGGGLARLDPVDGRLRRVPAVAGDGSPIDRRIQTLFVDRGGDLWIGSWNGLLRQRRGTDRIEPVALDAGTGTAGGQIISQLFEDAAGTLWIGTQQGRLYRFDPPTGRVAAVEDAASDRGATISAFAQPSPTQLWIGRDSGVEIRDIGDGRLLRQLRHDPLQPTSLAGNEVRALLRDRAGWIWTGGYGGGVQRHNPGNTGFRVRRGDDGHGGVFSDPSVRSVHEMANGEIWVGTQERGVAVFDAGLRLVGALAAGRGADARLGPGRISGITETPDGSAWIASDSGLYQRSPGSDALTLHREIKGRIRRLVAARNGLWIASEDGLYRHDPVEQRVQRVLTDAGEPLSGDVNAVAEAADGTLFVGSESGLYLVTPGSDALQALSSEPGHAMTHPLVLGLLFDRGGRLWIDTPNGLHRMLRRAGTLAAFEAVSERLGIGGRPFGANLLEDGDGRLWTHRFVHDPTGGSIYALGRADGADIGTGWFRSYAKTRDGRLLFGGSRGLLVVEPQHFRASTYAPPLVVSELKVNGLRRPLGDPARGLVLAPGELGFSIEFAALDYSAPQRLQYEYRLQGYNPDWIETDAGYRVASYGNLAPGDYVLHARGSNRSGEWSPHALTIPIRVLPQWWQTWWFRTLAALAAIAVVIALIQLRTANLRQRRRVLELKVQQRTAELEAVSLDLQAKSRALEEASLTDPLTGLRNRRFLSQHIESDIALTLRRYDSESRAGRPPPEDVDLVFFLIDIDHFKQVNDQHGHSAGDAVLLQMRGRLELVFRDSDYLVRWGGEEFLIVARATSRRHAEELAERARRSVAERPFVLDDGRLLDKSCSIGFACFPFLPVLPRALDWTGVVDLADAALYAAKRAGRDGWVGLLAGDACRADGLAERLKLALSPSLETGELRAVGSFPTLRIIDALDAPPTAVATAG